MPSSSNAETLKADVAVLGVNLSGTRRGVNRSLDALVLGGNLLAGLHWKRQRAASCFSK